MTCEICYDYKTPADVAAFRAMKKCMFLFILFFLTMNSFKFLCSVKFQFFFSKFHMVVMA